MRLMFAMALTSGCLLAQAAFDVASVKPSDPNATGGWVYFLPGGRFQVVNCQLIFIIQQVYGLKEYQIVDAPKWISDWKSRFNIEAKGDPSAPRDQLKIMAKALLAERFQLKVHRETRELSVYTMVAAKKGFNLHVAKDEPDRLYAGGIENVSPGVKRGRKVTMEDFIRVFEREVNRPILDGTGYKDVFDFRLEWAPEGVPPSEDARPSLFEALQQELGLKLELRKAPVEVLVVDHAAQPSAN
jgi:uncharacterized protein (TIGR03435 family)